MQSLHDAFPYHHLIIDKTLECLRSWPGEAPPWPGLVGLVSDLAGVLGVADRPPVDAPTEEAVLYLSARCQERLRELPPEVDLLLPLAWQSLGRIIDWRAARMLDMRTMGAQPPLILCSGGHMTPADSWTGLPHLTPLFPLWPDVRRRLSEVITGAYAYRQGPGAAPGAASPLDVVLHAVVWLAFLHHGVIAPSTSPPAGIDTRWYRIGVSAHWHYLAHALPHAGDALALADEVHRFVDDQLATIDLDTLRRRNYSPVGDVSAHYTVWYALEHTTHHVAIAELLLSADRGTG